MEMQQKILITGITGFLGSHIAQNLINNGLQVIGLKRKDSSIWRCEEFKEKIIWVDIDENGFFQEELEKYAFDSIVHGAWIGVGSDFRDNWNEQSKNISFLLELLAAAKTIGVKKFVFFGSQAEYGKLESKISEDHKKDPLNAYGSVKLACFEIFKTFCKTNQINWIWLRLFSLFGEKEGQKWLIPSLVSSMLTNKHMDFTPGEQKYAYLYVNDFSLIITRIMTMPVESGIYNISSDEARTIKSLLVDIKNYVNPEFTLNFGALKYRSNQSMHMEGDISKISAQIGVIKFTNFRISLQRVISYYLRNN